MSIPDIQPFLKPMDMINTSVVSIVILSSSSSAPLALSMGSSSPPVKKEVESGPYGNEGRKRSPSSLQGGPVLTCFVLVMEPIPVSLEFFTAPESLSKPSDES